MSASVMMCSESVDRCNKMAMPNFIVERHKDMKHNTAPPDTNVRSL